MGTRNLHNKGLEESNGSRRSALDIAECVLVKRHWILVVEVVAVEMNCQLALLLAPLSLASSSGSSVSWLRASVLEG